MSLFDTRWSNVEYGAKAQTFLQPYVGAYKTITTTLNTTDNGELCFVGTLRSLTLISFLKIEVRQYNHSEPFKVLGTQAMRHGMVSRKPRSAFAKFVISYLRKGQRTTKNRNTIICLVFLFRKKRDQSHVPSRRYVYSTSHRFR